MRSISRVVVAAMCAILLAQGSFARVEDLFVTCGPVGTVAGHYQLNCQIENRGPDLQEAVLLKAMIYSSDALVLGAAGGGVVDLAPNEVRQFTMVSEGASGAVPATDYSVQISRVAKEDLPPTAVYAARLRRRSMTIVGTGFGAYPDGTDPGYKVFVQKPNGSREEAQIAYWTDSAIVVVSSTASTGDSVIVNGRYGTGQGMIAGSSKSREKRR